MVVIGCWWINTALLQERTRDVHFQQTWQLFIKRYCQESLTQNRVQGFHIQSFTKGVSTQLAQSRGVRDANAKMECVERHVSARRKESVATVGALVTVIAAAGKYY
jgi:hypothetical protein